MRLLTVLYERNEALILNGALEAAGLVAFVENYNQVAAQPFSEIGLGGYRIMVVEEELDAAIAVLVEARAKPILDGERLVVRHLTILSLLLFFVFPGVVAPLKLRWWRDDGAKPA